MAKARSSQHPSPGYRLRTLTGLLAAFLAVPGCAQEAAVDRPGSGSTAGAPDAATPVRPGIAVLLSDSLHLVRGRRVGLITNHTGVWSDPANPGGGPPRSTIDLLYEHPEVELVALFGPEHGIRGEEQAGVLVADGRDERTGLPVYSLYGETRQPPPGSLENVDVLVYDIQDVGARYFTYVSTMTLAMETGVPFIVLDRPNPIGGVAVQGTVLDPAFATFVGRHPVPMRHGLTSGELARMAVGEFGIDTELHVVPVDGWTRDMTYDETGLPWIAPSPNLPSLESALHYPGTCLFEGTPLSVGRGTDRAFQQVGAPWLDGPALAEAMNARSLPGVRFEAVTFRPDNPGDGKFADEDVHGVRLVAVDETYDPTRTAVALLVEARRLAGERWSWRVSHFDRLAGTDRLRSGIEEGLEAAALTAEWDDPLERFRQRRSPYLIYR